MAGCGRKIRIFPASAKRETSRPRHHPRYPREKPALDLIGGGDPGPRLHSQPTRQRHENTPMSYTYATNKPPPSSPAKAGTYPLLSRPNLPVNAMTIPQCHTHTRTTSHPRHPRESGDPGPRIPNQPTRQRHTRQATPVIPGESGDLPPLIQAQPTRHTPYTYATNKPPPSSPRKRGIQAQPTRGIAG